MEKNIYQKEGECSFLGEQSREATAHTTLG